MESRDIIIIGAGPAGLSAARRLHEMGIRDVLVLEREQEAGGIPRHCGHIGFGWDSHRRLWTGPHFAAELRNGGSQVEVRTRTTVLELGREGRIRVQTAMGVREMQGRQVLLATGTRETPRAARLIGGTRPAAGVMTTGALQQHVYLHNSKPFERPVIIGSEWVSYSALLTCRHVGIKPVAMLEEEAVTAAPALGKLVARLAFGVPVRTGTRLVAIEGKQRVEAVEVERGGQRQRIACDGVVFTGKFQPELALVPAGSFLEGLGLGGIDRYLAAGNVLAPLKTSGKCWIEGRLAADLIRQRLA